MQSTIGSIKDDNSSHLAIIPIASLFIVEIRAKMNLLSILATLAAVLVLGGAVVSLLHKT